MAIFGSYNTSDHNADKTPLLANAEIEFILESRACTLIAGTVISDQAGTLYVDQSLDFDATDPDGAQDRTHWDYTTTDNVTGGTVRVIDTPVVAGIVRIRYVNGGADQAYLRIFVRATH